MTSSRSAASQSRAIADETREATWAAALLTAAGLVAGAGNLLFNVVVARLGGVEAYGGLGVLLALSTVTGFLATGVQYAVARHSSGGDAGTLALLRRSLLSVWPWLVATIPLSLCAVPIARYLHMPSAAPVLLSVGVALATLLGALPAGILLGERRFVFITALHVASVVLRIVVGVALVRVMEPITGSVLASLLPIVAVGFATFIVITKGTTAQPRLVVAVSSPQPRIGTEGTVSALYSAALWGVWSLPIVFARHNLDPSASGRFAAAQVVASGVLYLTAPLAMAFYPAIARHHHRRVVLSGFAVTGLTVLAAVAFLFFLGPLVIDRLYGARFHVSRGLLLALAISASMVALTTYGLWAARAMGRWTRTVGVVFAVALAAESALGATWHNSPDMLALGPGIALVGAVALTASIVRLVRPQISGVRPAPVLGRADSVVPSVPCQGDA